MQHTCPVTGKAYDQAEMLRLVLAPDGRVVPDVRGCLPGQALWVEASAEALGRCLDAVHQAFGANVVCAEGMAALVEAALVKHIQNCIALARRSSAAVAGFAKVEELLKTGRASLLIEAVDAGAADKTKLEKLAGYHHIPVVRALTREEMGIPMGKEASVHIALRNDALAAEIIKEMRRLAGFRKQDAL